MITSIPLPLLPPSPFELRLRELIKRLDYLIQNYGPIKIPVYGLSSSELFELMLQYNVVADENSNNWLISERV